ncbi:MAG TPA: hypothetical protein VLA61_09915 [Ideonella sp.]|uniref:hypothetical protein n=1 Tax=Ideonella sp. TaxID=1929293 RepID=UPI002B609745|nr:hypothetical protein [Ideonella sp.]HSI48575.1 hypothetical protein [Ideonella sp.]
MMQRPPSAPIAPTPFAAPVAVPDAAQATQARQAPCMTCNEQVQTEGRLCMSRDTEPWDSRHVVPDDANAYGLRRVDDAAGHDTRHEGSAQGLV